MHKGERHQQSTRPSLSECNASVLLFPIRRLCRVHRGFGTPDPNVSTASCIHLDLLLNLALSELWRKTKTKKKKEKIKRFLVFFALVSLFRLFLHIVDFSSQPLVLPRVLYYPPAKTVVKVVLVPIPSVWLKDLIRMTTEWNNVCKPLGSGDRQCSLYTWEGRRDPAAEKLGAGYRLGTMALLHGRS